MQTYQFLVAAFLITFHFPASAEEPSSFVLLKEKTEELKPKGGWPRETLANSVTNSPDSDNLNKAGKKAVTFLDEVPESKEPPVQKDALLVNAKPAPRSNPDSVIPKPDISSLIKPNDELEPGIAARKAGPSPGRKRPRSLYTLGPGDLVTFATFNRSDLNRSVRIAPDGTVSYLQAVAVNARGLTIDQLRNRMQEELRKYKRDIKIIVTPQNLQSKEFAVIGRVKKPGSFTLDRPTTILEGIALAEGVEIGTIRGSAYGLADFGRSFVSRNGSKLCVNLSKLYYEGDLDQNVYLQPNDYLYIASALKNECYVVGAVGRPGRIKMPSQTTLAGIISLSGGFNDEAYRMKVLIIRGDIETPEVHIVNMRDVLKGDARDEVIQNRDIIFVNKRPFEMVERVLDSAITTYMQTVTAELMNQNYSPFSL